ncbi:hypothetical protein CPB86DRAFT_802758 [Serendipita vermifera]|nr:hypothetical protein CPB86DRAFT_802758 [Serendipita vermifera]
MSTYSELDNQFGYTQEIEETVEVRERVQTERIRPQSTDATMSYQEALGYKSLKTEYQILEQKFLRQSKELADAQARLDKYEDINIETLVTERDSLNRELRQTQAEVDSLRYANEVSTRRVTSLEETITQMMTDHQEFKRSVFELFGLTETTTTKTTRETLHLLHKARDKLVDEKKAASNTHKEETTRLTMRVTELERLLEEEHKKAPTVSADAQANLLAQMENHQLNLLLDQERFKYSSLSRLVKIYREEREKECEQLEQQLETAHREMEVIQRNLRDMHQLATQTLTVSASTLPNINVAKQHKCNYSAKIFEAAIEESSTLVTPSPSTEGGRFEPRRFVTV